MAITLTLGMHQKVIIHKTNARQRVTYRGTKIRKSLSSDIKHLTSKAVFKRVDDTKHQLLIPVLLINPSYRSSPISACFAIEYVTI